MRDYDLTRTVGGVDDKVVDDDVSFAAAVGADAEVSGLGEDTVPGGTMPRVTSSS